MNAGDMHMRFFDNLKIIWKISLIVTVLGIALVVNVAYATSQLLLTVENYQDLSAAQSAANSLQRAQRRAETYHAALYAILTETTAEGKNRRLNAATTTRDQTYQLIDAAASEDPASAQQVRDVGASLKAAYAACDPVLTAGAEASTMDGNAKIAERAHRECDPVIDAALEKASKFVGASAEKVVKEKTFIKAEADATVRKEIAVAAGGLLIGIALALFMGIKSMSQPVARLKRAMERLANNDLSIDVPETGRGDEIGEMARTVEVFKINGLEVARLKQAQEETERRAAEQRRRDMHELANKFEQTVGDIANTVTSASTQLEASANTLSHTAERAQQLTSMVTSASNLASGNVQSVASATEELSSSVNEISRQVQESARMATEAVGQVRNTNDRVGELSKAAARIGDVVELINTIAGQTNLLALNATIEAARAGEAGRGFAVVATEVKALAEQTAKATGEIGQQIAGIQTATQESVGSIKEISATIERLSEIASTIAAAVEEQGAATQEISRNVQHASQGTKEVSTNIVDVQRGASETGAASSQVLAAAKTLSSNSERLKAEIMRFLGTVRAA